MIPKTKKIRNDNRRTLPSIGRVSRRSVTRMRIPARNRIQVNKNGVHESPTNKELKKYITNNDDKLKALSHSGFSIFRKNVFRLLFNSPTHKQTAFAKRRVR